MTLITLVTNLSLSGRLQLHKSISFYVYFNHDFGYRQLLTVSLYGLITVLIMFGIFLGGKLQIFFFFLLLHNYYCVESKIRFAFKFVIQQQIM
jgi:hypothetical protein